MSLPTFRQWRNGEIFNARDYIYERNAITTEINRIAALLTAQSDLTLNKITLSELSLGGVTISSFDDVIEGIDSYLQGDEPTDPDIREGDLWFDTTP